MSDKSPDVENIEYWTAGLVIGCLVFLIAVRYGFRSVFSI